MSEPFVVVATYRTTYEAKMATELLASEGIAFRTVNDGIGSVHPLLAPALGGVRVLVAAKDAGKASELLQLRGLAPGGKAPAVDFASLEDEAMEAEPADESVGDFLKSQKKRRD